MLAVRRIAGRRALLTSPRFALRAPVLRPLATTPPLRTNGTKNTPPPPPPSTLPLLTQTATPADPAPKPPAGGDGSSSSTPTAAVAKKPLLQRLREDTWPHIKEELIHYKEGSKLLAYEVRLSFRYVRKLLQGQRLTRREHRQLRRTVSDLVRLVPFAVLVIIPFAELALPVLLKLFPNMLPSTFEKQFEEEEKRKKMLKMRLELAKFLQETVDEMAITNGKGAEAAKEFTDFFSKIRRTGEPANTSDLIKIAQKFEDELTMENLSRPQLVSMCKYMGLKAFGTDNYLRYQIRARMAQLHSDDAMIAFEKVDSLTVPELQRACADRGIKTIGVSPARLRHELQQWLDLHLAHKIPISLLILSRAFIISDKPMYERVPPPTAAAPEPTAPAAPELSQPTAEALQATLQSLPDTLITEAELKLSDLGKDKFKKRLESLKQQEEIIAEELAQDQAAAREKQRLKEEAAAAAAATTTAPPKSEVAAAVETSPQEESQTAPTATFAESAAEPEPAAEPVLAPSTEDVKMSREQVMELGEALKVLASKSAVDTERVELETLLVERAADKQKMAQLVGDVVPPEAHSALAAAHVTEPLTTPSSAATMPPPSSVQAEVTPAAGTELAAPAAGPTPPESAAAPAVDPALVKATSRIDSQVSRLVSKIAEELARYDAEVGSKLNRITANERGQITVADLENTLRVIRSRPRDDAEIKAMVAKLDVDGDGLVAIQDVLELAREVEEQSEVEGHGVVLKEEEEEQRRRDAQSKPTGAKDAKDTSGTARSPATSETGQPQPSQSAQEQPPSAPKKLSSKDIVADDETSPPAKS